MAAATSAASFVATRSNASKITRWSLNSLAKIGNELKSHGTLPCLELARDITLRLGTQQAHVEQLESFVHQSLNSREGEGTGEQQHNNPNKENRRIVRTSNFSQPQWWKAPVPTAEDAGKRKMKLEKAQTNLRNLRMLHQSTYDMVEQLWVHLENKDAPSLDTKERKWMNASLKQVRDRHAMTVENLAEFVIETRPYLSSSAVSERNFDTTVMNFLRGRFGVQLLCEHAVASRGIICVDCHLQDVLEDAISEAKLLCESHYSHLVTAAPEVVIVNQTGDRKDQFTIVRPWVHYALVELLKNAMSASMESLSPNGDDYLLPPNIYIAIDDHHDDEGSESGRFLSIDVFDQGGGFKSDLAKNPDTLFGFVKNKETMWDRLDDQQTYAMTRSPMQGLGVGLCLSRLMMSHFGGTLELMEHPPLLQRQQERLRELSEDLDKGCVASIMLQKDLDYPEQFSEDSI